PSSPPAASARTSGATAGVTAPWAPRLKSPASAYPRESLPPQKPAPDLTAPSVASSAADIPTDSHAEKRASQRHSSPPRAVPRSAAADRADPQSGQRSSRGRRETRQTLTSLTAASGQYTASPASVYPRKRSNSQTYLPSAPLLFCSPRITGPPPVLQGAGIKGSRIAHWASVRSEGYAFRFSC